MSMTTEKDESPHVRPDEVDISSTARMDDPSVSQLDVTHVLTDYYDSDESLDTAEKLLSKSADYTIVDSIPTQELMDTINLLRSEYSILQNEFDNTTLDTINLRQQITKLTKDNDMLKTLCRSPLSDIRRTNSTSKKRNILGADQKYLFLALTLEYLHIIIIIFIRIKNHFMAALPLIVWIR